MNSVSVCMKILLDIFATVAYTCCLGMGVLRHLGKRYVSKRTNDTAMEQLAKLI
jgi:uncharacterized membrane protein YqgA involved in biofilm formation